MNETMAMPYSVAQADKRAIVKDQIVMLKLLGKRMSKQIIDMLNERREMCMTDIMIKLRCEQSMASQRLNDLERYRILHVRQAGKQRYYSLNIDRIEQIQGALNRFFA